MPGRSQGAVQQNDAPSLLLVGGRVLMPGGDLRQVDVLVEAGRVARVAPELTAPASGLVTDAMRGAGMPDGVYTFGGPEGLEAVVKDGVTVMPDNSGFASSTVRMKDLVRDMVELVGVPLPEALQMASTTPASVLGLSDRKGAIEPGKDADLVLLDQELDVALTIRGGVVTYQRD